MLEVKNMVKTFFKGTVNEKTALQGVNLKLEEGDFVTVIGGNGAGKSTLLNSVAGVFPIDEGGEILIGGNDVTKMPEYKRAKYIGRVFQDPMVGTAGNMQIEENLLLALRRGKKLGLKWAFVPEEREFFKERLSLLGLGLEDRLTARMGLLSGGQRQSITLLMATMLKPELLLLDEHTAALDPRTAENVLQLTDKLVQEHNLTTLMITHNMRDALRFGNRLIMMNAGQIIFDVRGDEKKNMTVQDLLERFSVAAEGAVSDRMMLAKD
ncbi:MAG: ABC transporter ATP-binding protein [Negativicutes bacterium]|nr:ABC transporter ATP-binding protein [Negativicutes bacterium]